MGCDHPEMVRSARADTGAIEGASTVLTAIYWGVCVLMLVLCALELWTEKDFWKQATAAMVIVPLVLRVLNWK